MKAEAVGNILRDLRSQFLWRGSLPSRLAGVSAYYLVYGAYRARGSSQDESRAKALLLLSHRLGLAGRMARIRLQDGLSLELDLFSSSFLAKELLVDKTYEALPEYVPREGQTVFDVGAHQGLFTTRASRRVGPAGRVVAFEPAAGNRDILERNIAANELSNVTVVAAAAAEKAGTTALFNSLLLTDHSMVHREPGSEETTVPTTTLDETAARLDIRKVDLLKIDVEGAALSVLRGARSILASKPRIVMEVEGPQAEGEAAARLLEGAGLSSRRINGIYYAGP